MATGKRQSKGKGKVLPNPDGNRRERRLATRLERSGRTPPARRSAEELVERVMAVPNWKTMNAADLAKQLGMTSLETTQVRQLIMHDLARARERDDALS